MKSYCIFEIPLLFHYQYKTFKSYLYDLVPIPSFGNRLPASEACGAFLWFFRRNISKMQEIFIITRLIGLFQLYAIDFSGKRAFTHSKVKEFSAYLTKDRLIGSVFLEPRATSYYCCDGYSNIASMERSFDEWRINCHP